MHDFALRVPRAYAHQSTPFRVLMLGHSLDSPNPETLTNVDLPILPSVAPGGPRWEPNPAKMNYVGRITQD